MAQEQDKHIQEANDEEDDCVLECDLDSVEVDRLHIPGQIGPLADPVTMDTESTIGLEVRSLVRKHKLRLNAEEYTIFVVDNEGEHHWLEHSITVQSVHELLSFNSHIELLQHGDTPNVQSVTQQHMEQDMGVNL